MIHLMHHFGKKEEMNVTLMVGCRIFPTGETVLAGTNMDMP